jgi:2-dehydro-3-deoxy-D-pentonate aldolase
MNSGSAPALSGIFVPLIVPYDRHGRVAADELRRIVRWLGERGVSGFYPNGSMGEFIRLGRDERIEVARIVADEAAGRPVLAGAAEANVAEVLDMCARCADLGCRAVSITGPYYYQVSQESIEAYFREIAAQSPIDIVVYNIPAFASEISVPVLRRLALDCPRIVGTKDSSRDLARFQRLIREIKPQRPDFSILMGWEELLCASLLMGGDGGTLSSAGVAPELVMKLYRTARAGHWDEARHLQYLLADLFRLMIDAPNFPEGFRSGYELRGFTAGHARFPLSDNERATVADLRGRLACALAAHGFAEAARECRMPEPASAARAPATQVDAIVAEVRRRLASTQP